MNKFVTRAIEKFKKTTSIVLHTVEFLIEEFARCRDKLKVIQKKLLADYSSDS